MHDDAFFKVVYIPLASSWTSFHRSSARWRYLVNRQSTTDGALWYLNGSSWTSCLIKLDSFISQNHRCRRFGVNELHFAHLSYLLGNYSLSYYSYRVFFSFMSSITHPIWFIDTSLIGVGPWNEVKTDSIWIFLEFELESVHFIYYFFGRMQ